MSNKNSVQPWLPDHAKNYVPAEPPTIELEPRERRTVTADNKPSPTQMLIVTLAGWALFGVVAWWVLSGLIGHVGAALLSLVIVTMLVLASLVIFNGDLLGWVQIAADKRIDMRRLDYEDDEMIRRHETARHAIDKQAEVDLARIEQNGATARIDQVEHQLSRLITQQNAPTLPTVAAAPSFVPAVTPNSGAAFDDRKASETQQEAMRWVRENLYTADGRPTNVHPDGRLKVKALWSRRGKGHQGHLDALTSVMPPVVVKPINGGGYALNVEQYPTADHLPR